MITENDEGYTFNSGGWGVDITHVSVFAFRLLLLRLLLFVLLFVLLLFFSCSLPCSRPCSCCYCFSSLCPKPLPYPTLILLFLLYIHPPLFSILYKVMDPCLPGGFTRNLLLYYRKLKAPLGPFVCLSVATT